MRRYKSVFATTRIDVHGFKFTKKSLESAAQSMNGRYVPLLAEHDVLRPLGRVSTPELRQEADGEWSMVQTVEELEPGDHDVGRDPSLEFVPNRPEEPGISADVGLEFMRTAESKAAVAELELLTGANVGQQGRRALDPPDLIKITGLFVLCQVAGGFLQQFGADGYTKLKSAIHKVFESRVRPDGSRRLEFELYFEHEEVQVILVQSEPTEEGIEGVLGRGLTELDKILPDLLAAFPDARRVVAEYSASGVRICYLIGADCLPIAVHRKGDPR